MSRVRNAAVLFVLLAIGLLPAVAQDPPRPVALRTLWKFTEAPIDHVAAHAGIVYVGFGGGSLVALRADDGSEVWRRKLGTEGVVGVARVGEEKVEAILVNHGKGLALLDRLTGEPKWNREMPEALAEPVAVGKICVAGGGDGRIHARSLENGDPVWDLDYLKDAPPDPPGFAGDRARYGNLKARPGPAASDGTLVVIPVFDQCRAIAVDAATGKRTSTFPARGWMYMRPTFAGRFVLVAGQDGLMRCFDKETGAEVWTHATKARVEAACSVRDDRVYWGSCDGRLYCLGLERGELLWAQPLGEDPEAGLPIYERPAIAGNILMQPLLTGEVLAIDRGTGKVLGRHRPDPDAEIEGAAWAGALLFVETRRSIQGKGEEALFAVGR